MSVRISSAAQRVTRWLGSATCWRIIFGLFAVQAVWLIFSARYPMAFDENYHFGLIQLHAQQWLPFFTHQPAETSVYGAIVRDPSYLYHWLMSFPYRGISLFTHNQTTQIISLRLINVTLFGFGLLLYRRIVLRIGTSKALTNSLFAVFVLIPVVPFLAAHINYDNLLFAMLPGCVLLAFRLMHGFEAKRVEAGTALSLLILLLLGSLVKYPFLPIVLVLVLFLGWKLWRSKLIGRNGWHSFKASFLSLSRLRQIVLVVVCLLSMGLFVERYGMNVISYHSPVPDCDVALSQTECMDYGPFGRDYRYSQEKPASFHASVFGYAWQWLYGMWYRLFFAINYNYATARPLLIISWSAVVAAVLLVGGIAVRFKALFRRQPLRQLLVWLMFGYVAVLFIDGFTSYAKTGQPVAINGRYLIPFLPFVFAFGGMAWSQILHSVPTAKAAAASLVIGIFLLQGGGAMTYIVRSDDTWFWNNSAVQSVNRTVRTIVQPIIIGKNIW